MVFHPSHRPLEIATRFPQFHSPDDDDISPTNKKHKGTLLSSYRGGHFYWALTRQWICVDISALGRYTSECRARGTRGVGGLRRDEEAGDLGLTKRCFAAKLQSGYTMSKFVRRYDWTWLCRFSDQETTWAAAETLRQHGVPKVRALDMNQRQLTSAVLRLKGKPRAEYTSHFSTSLSSGTAVVRSLFAVEAETQPGRGGGGTKRDESLQVFFRWLCVFCWFECTS